MDAMHSTNGKTRKSGHSLAKAAITSTMASSQVVEWHLPLSEDIYLAGSIPCWSDTRH